MAFNDLLSTSFLFSIAIIIILIGGIFAYVSYRMSEQDHKITSMVGLISTMAEELQFFRSKLSQEPKTQPQELKGGLFKHEDVSDQRHSISILDPNNLITRATSLISVSDDEVSESDSNSGSETESETGSETDSETDSESVDGDFELDEVVDLEEPTQISINNIDENIDEVQISDPNIKSIHLEEPIEINGFVHEHEHEPELEPLDHLLASDLKTISITDLEDTNKKLDYKKMTINKLREVVTEKGIVTDATKLKKNELLKLLGDE